MANQTITAANLDQTIGGGGIVLLDFWADWCGPGRMFGPIFEAAFEKYRDTAFGKVHTEAERELAADFQITSLPTPMAFRDGILAFSQTGALPPAGLQQVVDAVQGLDMDKVRAQIFTQAGDPA